MQILKIHNLNSILSFQWIKLILCALLLITLQNPVNADPVSDYKKGNEFYQKQDYENAIKIYEGLIKNGDASAEVYYNLGNCYFKTDNIAHAMLNYERARKILPDDDDINFNIKIASLKVVDKMDAVPEIFYKRWLKAIASEFATDSWSTFLIVCTWLLFLFFAIYVVSPSASMKKFGFVSGIAFILVTAFVFVFTEKSHSMNFVDQQAIITSASVYVKNSPDEKGSDQFIIHEGTKVDVLDALGDWKKIRIANGSIGWLKLNEIEVI